MSALTASEGSSASAGSQLLLVAPSSLTAPGGVPTYPRASSLAATLEAAFSTTSFSMIRSLAAVYFMSQAASSANFHILNAASALSVLAGVGIAASALRLMLASYGHVRIGAQGQRKLTKEVR